MSEEQNSSAEKAPAEKPCRHCQTPIPINARVCSVCKLSQNKWWSWLQVVSPSTALIVAAISLFAWFLGLLPKLHVQFWPKTKLVLFRCNSMDGAVVFNAGDVPLFVSRVTLLSKGKTYVTPEIPFYETVEPGKFIKALPSSMKDFENLKNGYWERTLSEEKLAARIQDATSEANCTRIALFSEGDPTLFKFRAETSKNTVPLQQIEAAGFLEYRAIGSPDTPQFITFPVVGLILALTKPGCPVDPLPPAVSTETTARSK